ncbi:MAG: hypothetical protein PHH82_00295 [Candidatus ainarchaeum sp.]|nr:hypothetical protein [Candidatus ainarchaeum sp.]
MINMADYRFEMCKKSNVAKFGAALDKGLVDKMLIPFLKKINKKPNIYSSSCCAGRIMVIGLDTEESKQPNLFVLKEHRKVKLSEIKGALKTNKFPELWLKQEPFIFHFGAKDLETAKKFLEIKTRSGIRRGGIFYVKDDKYLVELIGSQTLAVPIKIGKKVLLSDEQIKIILEKANKKLERNYKQLKEFCKELLKIE